MLNEQLKGLSTASEKKKQEALFETEKAIAKLIDENQKISIRSVAREAGVSISYLYKYPELAYKIQQLKEEQRYSLVIRDRSEGNAGEKVKRIQQEQAELIQEITELRAIIDRAKTGENALEDLKAENMQLRSENQQLKKELQHTKKNLQEAREFILGKGCENQSGFEFESTIKIIRET